MSAASKGWGQPGSRYRAANIVRLDVAGVTVYVHRDVAVIFAYFLRDLDTHLRRKGKSLAKERDDWGYAHRYISGTTTWSNHAWGLAVDANAIRNPYVKRLVTEFDPRWVRWLLAGKYKNLIRWGGDYSGRKDAMHFEFMGTPAQARALTALLRASSKPTKRPVQRNPYPVPNFAVPFGLGAKGSKVQYVQWALGLEPDGDYGPKTKAAVASFQTKNKLGRDGAVGPATGRLLARITR